MLEFIVDFDHVVKLFVWIISGSVYVINSKGKPPVLPKVLDLVGVLVISLFDPVKNLTGIAVKPVN